MSFRPSYTLLDWLDEDPELHDSHEHALLSDGKFLGIAGLRLRDGAWGVAKAIRIQPVTPRSGPHVIERALRDEAIAAIIGRYSKYVTYELAIGPDVAVGDDAVAFGKSFISLLRVRVLADILVPAALQCSWSAATLNQLPAGSCEATLIEDIPNLMRLEDPTPVSSDDLNWIVDNMPIYQTLSSTSDAYALAVDSLAQHNHQTSLRMSAAMLWSGIEALFAIKGEITYRLAMYIAAFLEPPGESRHSLFLEVKRQYNTRSRIVHGDASDLSSISKHIISTRRLLSRLICRVTESQGLSNNDALDILICGSAIQMAQNNRMVSMEEH